MESFLKKIISSLILFSVLGFAQAQTSEQVKSDDVLKFRIVQLVSVGQSFSDGAESSDSASVKIDQTTGERTYTTAKEGVVLRKNNLFGTLQRNKYLFAADEIDNLFRTTASVGEKWKEVVYFNSNRCGRVKNDYEVSITQGPDVVVKIKGVPVALKTIQVAREGMWYAAGRCGGSGTKYLKVLFSPELNEIVHDEYRTYDRGILSVGEKKILESIN